MHRNHWRRKFWWLLLAIVPMTILSGCAVTPGREQPLAAIVNSVYSPDGALIAVATSEREVALFDAQPLWFRRVFTKEGEKKAASKQLAEIVADQYRPLPLGFSPDGKVVVAGGITGSIVAWDVESGSEKYRVPISGSVNDVVFFPDGQSFVAAGSTVAIRRTNDGFLHREIVLPVGVMAGAVAISPDGRLLVVGQSTGELTIYDIPTYRLLRTLSGHAAPVTGLAFKPGGIILASTAGGYDLRFWRQDATGDIEKTDSPFAVTSAAEDSFGSAQGAGALLWILGTIGGARIVGAPTMGAPPFLASADSQFSRAARTVPFHCGSRVVFSANGRFVASTANLLECPDCIGRLAPAFLLFVTDLETGKTVTARDRGCSVSFSPDGRVITAGGVGAPALLDSMTGNPLTSAK